MAISREFNYKCEDEFTQSFIIPLLQRLGFSLVVNYHGHAEFGKDLVFAELDRFGHVRYHGLQVKYEASISLNEIDSLIADCRQAFANPFRHPQTGTVERVSTFYAATGGSIGPEATQHYFNSLLPQFGGNARLLQGKDLVTLDRWASFSRTEDVLAVANGILLELSYNDLTSIPRMTKALRDRGGGGPSWSLDRLRTDALSSYLRRPVLKEFVKPFDILQYCHLAELANREMQLVGQGVLSPEMRVTTADTLLLRIEKLAVLAKPIRTALEQVLLTIGPLLPL